MRARTPCGRTMLCDSSTRSHAIAIFCNVLDRWVDKGVCAALKFFIAHEAERVVRETFENLGAPVSSLILSLVNRLSRSSLWASRPSLAPLERPLCRQPWLVLVDGPVRCDWRESADRLAGVWDQRALPARRSHCLERFLADGRLVTDPFALGHRRLPAEQTCCLPLPAVRRPSATC